MISKQIDFFITMMPSGGFMCITIAFCSFFSGREKTLIVAFVTVVACTFCCVLDYIFIFGNWGSPKLGIVGAGLATTLSQAFGALFVFTFFISQNQKVYPTRRILLINVEDIKRIIKFGLPSGIQSVTGLAAFTSIIFLIGSLGEVAVAATAIAASIDYIAFLPLMGMFQATSIVVAKHIGRNRVDISEKQANVAIKMSLVYILITSTFLIVFPDILFNLFRPENDISNFLEVIKNARGILICAAFYNFFDALYFVYAGVLVGAGDTKFMMYLSLFFNFLVWVPGVAVCIFILKLDVVGVWIFMAVYIAMGGIVLFLRFKTGKWKKIQLIDTNIPSRSCKV
jgi:MATE family multidrug resistance protein